MSLIITFFKCNLLFNYQLNVKAYTDDIDIIKYSILGKYSPVNSSHENHKSLPQRMNLEVCPASITNRL